MTNLLQDTLNILAYHNKTWQDVVSIQTNNGHIQVKDYIELSNKEFDSDYGHSEVDPTLVIIFKDNSWLSRGEYDGSEWWDYNETPIIDPNYDSEPKLFDIWEEEV